MGRRYSSAAAFSMAGALAACDGPQSALRTGGVDAAQLAQLFWVMLGGAVVLWLLVNGLFLYVTRINTGSLSRKWAEALIIGGGIVFPTTVLTALLAYGLTMMPDQRAPGDGLRVRITGEQWWWRVEYWPEGAETPVISANELRLPAGLRSEIELTSAEVIHSFWVPGLGGKTDMFPGRPTRMSLEPTEPGSYRGQCAEFCGASHALMAMQAVVMEPAAFDAWLAKEAAPASLPEGPGRDLFFREGCGACHSLRGTEAVGAVGPDLTHLGGRSSLAAGILPMTSEALARWIADPASIKPEAHMPAYSHLSDAELASLAGWLEQLQ